MRHKPRIHRRGLLFLLATLLLPVISHAQVVLKLHGVWYYIPSTTGSSCQTYPHEDRKSLKGELVLPEKIVYKEKSYELTGIGNSSFEGCKDLTSVTIPNSVKSIASSAFSGCTGLTSVTIPNSVTGIDYGAFSGCPGLTSVTIPNSVRWLTNPFSGCTGLQEIKVDENNQSFQDIDGVLFSKDVSRLYVYPAGRSGVYTIPNSVTDIYDYAFSGCTGLTDVTIPNSVTEIGWYAFSGCTGLTDVTIPNSVTEIGWYVFSGCTGLTDVTIPNSVTDIGESAFSGCTGLTSVTIPNSVIRIEGGAFSGCTGLQEIKVDENNQSFQDIDGVLCSKNGKALWIYPAGRSGICTIPNSVTRIGESAFSGCTGLTSVTIPNSVTRINGGAFSGCTGLTSVTIPNSVIQIGGSAFSGCTGLKNITIPNSVTEVGYRAFYDCTIPKLNFYTRNNANSYARALSGLNTNSHIYCFASEYDMIKKAFEGEVTGTQPYDIDILEVTLSSVRFKLVPNKEMYDDFSNFKFTLRLGDGEEIADVVPNKEYTIANLTPGTQYTFVMDWTPAEEGDGKLEINFTTPKREISCDWESTQTTVTIKSIIAPNDNAIVPEVTYSFHFDAYKKYEGKEIKFKNLKPGYTYYFDVKADYNGKVVSKEYTIKTSSIYFGFSDVMTLGATAVKLIGDYDAGDAEVSECWWSYGGKKYEGKEAILTGLIPESKDIPLTFYVKTDKGYEYSTTFKTTLPALELTTLQPKCTSASTAIVAATTNIADVEPNVGFQWKKYDAPASLKPNEGYAAIYDGVLEGNIKNLQSTSYYNVRAFYKDAAGTYYYSDWVTFDPSDFSYFEPTVHTYPIEDIQSESATLRGYVLTGSDNILSQGFRYWPLQKQSMVAFGAPAASDVQTVEATGQVMSAVVGNLKPGTTYVFQAYAVTEAGTKYGEEQQFTTLEGAGVEDISADNAAPEIIGYYDLSGRRYDVPQRGLNIVVYSNGTARKILHRE